MPQGPNAKLASRDLWSTCPPDILAKCFRSQQDYVDNSAAACVCTSWRNTFRGSAEQITIHQNPLNEDLLSRTYLRQFTGLRTVELRFQPEWPPQDDSSWLTAKESQVQGDLVMRGVPLWVEMMGTILPSCCHLKLHGYFWDLHLHLVGTCSQLAHLQSLHIHSDQSFIVSLLDVAQLIHLQSLSLVGYEYSWSGSIRVLGRLQVLPAGITDLRLNHCHTRCSEENSFWEFCLGDLSRLPELTSVDLSHCRVGFGRDSVVADLRPVKVLVLAGAFAANAQSVIASLATATQLQELNLREFQLDRVQGQYPVLQLGRLLSSLLCLQKLDVTDCVHVELDPSDYTQLRLHTFACDYHQLSLVSEVPFTSCLRTFRARQGNIVRPSLQIEVIEDDQHWLGTLPWTALTHLTLHNAHGWVSPWFLAKAGVACDRQRMPNLHYLDIRFAEETIVMHDVSLPVGCKVQELYVAGTSCENVDLADCTSLVSLGVMHTGRNLPGLGWPTCLQRLCLHNVLSADTARDLGRLNSLECLKLGGQANTKNIMKHLPELPPSLLKLDLWDGVVTDLTTLLC